MAKKADLKPSSRKEQPKRIRKLKSSDYGGMSQSGFHNFMDMLRAFGATESQVDQFAAAFLYEIEKHGESFEITANERLMKLYKEITKIGPVLNPKGIVDFLPISKKQ